jgi:hypothetical protein
VLRWGFDGLLIPSSRYLGYSVSRTLLFEKEIDHTEISQVESASEGTPTFNDPD